MPRSETELLVKIESFKNVLISRALGTSQREVEYETLRRSLLHTTRVACQLPQFVRTCQTLNAFWEMIRQEYKVPAERKRRIQVAFRPVITMLTSQSKPHVEALPQVTRESPDARPVRAFLCHSSADKPAVKILYGQLLAAGIQPWLDEVDLVGGQDWDREIRKAVRDCDVAIVCLSQSSVTKTGYVQKEIGVALDRADEKPEGTIYIIPLRLEDCDVPDRLKRWHWVNLHKKGGLGRLLSALKGPVTLHGPQTLTRATPSKRTSGPRPRSIKTVRAKPAK